MPKVKNSTRKPGRPSKASALTELSARQKIIETALKLFYRYGIHTVGVDRIIEESQVAKMTFFKHFPTKRDLVLEFLKVRDDRYLEWLEKTLESVSKDKKNRLLSALKVIEIWFKDSNFRGCAFINTAVEVGPGEFEEKIICVSHKKRLSKFLQTLAQESGYVNCEELANQLVTVIDGATVRAQMDGPVAGIKALNDCTDALLKKYEK